MGTRPNVDIYAPGLARCQYAYFDAQYWFIKRDLATFCFNYLWKFFSLLHLSTCYWTLRISPGKSDDIVAVMSRYDLSIRAKLAWKRWWDKGDADVKTYLYTTIHWQRKSGALLRRCQHYDKRKIDNLRQECYKGVYWKVVEGAGTDCHDVAGSTERRRCSLPFWCITKEALRVPF